jgi:hypothetical protein
VFASSDVDAGFWFGFCWAGDLVVICLVFGLGLLCLIYRIVMIGSVSDVISFMSIERYALNERMFG